MVILIWIVFFFFFFNDTATTEIYTLHIVGSVRCVQETDIDLMQLNIFMRLFFLDNIKLVSNLQKLQQIVQMYNRIQDFCIILKKMVNHNLHQILEGKQFSSNLNFPMLSYLQLPSMNDTQIEYQPQ
eukprot:TRINITY_DN7271_c0_g1_i1.p2 TRINITY_DN7271_c0_g1~~TRINITY_DN7271_c0_g1_i1.p2  ORF type:complete len:127 (-),score=26.87 TRINITY_DN7271_c0_g1_i1:458-838(-)